MLVYKANTEHFPAWCKNLKHNHTKPTVIHIYCKQEFQVGQKSQNICTKATESENLNHKYDVHCPFFFGILQNLLFANVQFLRCHFILGGWRDGGWGCCSFLLMQNNGFYSVVILIFHEVIVLVFKPENFYKTVFRISMHSFASLTTTV